MENRYGDWRDYLLCVGIAVLLGAKLPMRRARWRKKQREARAASVPAQRVDSVDSSATDSLRNKLWSWPVIGAIVLLCLGGGISMSSGHPYIADGFYVAGMTLLVVRLLTWPDIRGYRPLSVGAGLLFLVAIIAGTHKMNEGNQPTPFSIEPLTLFVTEGDIQSVNFWLNLYGGPQTKACPIGAAFFIMLTNRQDSDVSIVSAAIDIRDNTGDWSKDEIVYPGTGVILQGRISKPTEVDRIIFDDGFLLDKISGKLLSPKIPWSGWIMVQEKGEYAFIKPPRSYRIRIKDSGGKEMTQELNGPSIHDNYLSGASTHEHPFAADLRALFKGPCI
jgi:hypothetical protein